jgi:quercetin dioxygenase-like cupin family protein
MAVPPDSRHLRRSGHSISVAPADMKGRVAQFEGLSPDMGAFPDLKDSHHARTVWYMLSPHGLAGEPSPIRAQHGFHMAIMRMPRGMRPSTHAHPYNEVFMPLDARFRFFYGENEAHSVEVGRYGVISVPAGVMRTFENLDDHDAHVLAIFDTPGDPHAEMLISPRDFEKFYKDGWVPGVEPSG